MVLMAQDISVKYSLRGLSQISKSIDVFLNYLSQV